MTLPVVQVSIRPDSSFVVGGTGVLGSVKLGALPLGTPFLLGAPAAAFVPITGTALQVSINRGRTRVTDNFTSGSATVKIADTTGQFNPDNTSSNLYPFVLPLRQFRISITVGSTVYAMFNGFTTRFTYDYEPGTNLTYVTIQAEDAFHVLNQSSVTTVAGAALNDLSSTRINQILDALSVPNTLRDIGTGDTQIANDSGQQRNGLEAIQQVERTEVGAFYISKAGFYTFKSRKTVQQLQAGTINTPLVFDESSNLRFMEIRQGLDDDQVFNSVSISGDLITTTTVSDQASIDDYFLRLLSRSGSLLTTNAEASDQANFLLANRKTPTLTIDRITCNPLALTTAQAQSLANAEVLDPITLTKNYGGTSLTRTLTIQGISHDITPGSWIMDLQLAEPVGGDALVLDSSTSGKLDTNLLAY